MQQHARLPLWFLIANMALVAAAFAFGNLLGRRRFADLPEPQRTALELVFNEIQRSHIDPQDPRKLLDHAIAGMVKELDPYSRYVPPSEVAQYEEQNTGHYEGIGVQMGAGDVIYYPHPGSPAERAGIRPGDRILAVDGMELEGIDKRRIYELVRGPAGTEVKLRLQRGNTTTVEIAVRRGDVQKNCVKWAHLVVPEEQLGYVHLADFHPGCAKALADAITRLRGDGQLRGLVLDLRHDGGGSLDECLAIARSFLPSGLIVSQQRRDSEVVDRYEATPELCRFGDLPLVVLVNEVSASASEVLAGALQDHARAAIVGQRTYGKGFVNTVYTWANHDFRLKLTTGAYLTPNGRNIERRHRHGDATGAEAGGIEPDVIAAVTTAQRLAIEKVLDEPEPPAAYLEAFTALAIALRIPVPEPPRIAEDPQLAQAVATLRARVAVGKNGAAPNGTAERGRSR
ncbi:MAG TPA: S41 family peptidase [Planctomycetota bacterium]|nr:S41 family peptidase [Planctomycetota bacterium]